MSFVLCAFLVQTKKYLCFQRYFKLWTDEFR